MAAGGGTIKAETVEFGAGGPARRGSDRGRGSAKGTQVTTKACSTVPERNNKRLPSVRLTVKL